MTYDSVESSMIVSWNIENSIAVTVGKQYYSFPYIFVVFSFASKEYNRKNPHQYITGMYFILRRNYAGLWFELLEITTKFPTMYILFSRKTR